MRTAPYLIAVLIAALVIYGIYHINNQPRTVAEVNPNVELDFDQTIEKGTVSQKIEFIRDLARSDRKGQLLPVELDRYRKIIALADGVINADQRSDEDYIFAVKAKVLSLGENYALATSNGLDDPAFTEELISTAERYSQDEHDEVSRVSSLSLVRTLLSEALKTPGTELDQKLIRSFVDMVKNHLEDQSVLDNSKRLFSLLCSRNLEVAKSLAEQLNASTAEGESQNLASLKENVSDAILLFELGIGNFNSIQDIKVDDGEFLKRLTQINETQTIGIAAVRQLANAIGYFESQGKDELAKTLCQRMIDESVNKVKPEVAELASSYGKDGLKRSSVLGQSWNFETVDANGEPVTSDFFANRVVLVLFYSPVTRNAASIKDLVKQLYAKYRGREFAVATVRVLGQNSQTGDENVPWTDLVYRVGTESDYFSQCPAKTLPYALLIDKNGIVDAINVQLNTVTTQIEELLSQER